MNNGIAKLLKSPFILGYLVLYFVTLLLLHIVEGFDVTEPIFVFVVLGIGFTALAWWSTKGVGPLEYVIKRPVSECIVLIACLLVVTAFITWGLDAIHARITSEPLRSLGILAAKLLVFVLLPFVLFRGAWNYSARELFNASPRLGNGTKAALWISGILILFQAVLGRGLSIIGQSGFSWWSYVIGIPLAYLWLVVEVGLVEEFFFRALIQSRIAALLKSEIGALVFMSVLFGLTHAPGMYLRTARTLEILGPSPSLLLAIGYSIVITSVAGFFLGVLWMRTRNLTLLILVHAVGDLLPNATGIIKAWIP